MSVLVLISCTCAVVVGCFAHCVCFSCCSLARLVVGVLVLRSVCCLRVLVLVLVQVFDLKCDVEKIETPGDPIVSY